MNALVVGAGGQLGRELIRVAPERFTITAADRPQLDIREKKQVRAFVNAARPTVILNAAAYTAVDRAEAEPEHAFAVNASGPEHLARAAVACGARLIHLSTDFVFDGFRGRPYRVQDTPQPLSVYGESKLRGEIAVQEICGAHAAIVRTSWVYSRFGKNFVRTILGLLAERDELQVVVDQIGSPTWVGTLAPALWEIAGRPEVHGTLHWTDAGVASWYDFAMAIQQIGIELGLPATAIPIIPVTTEAFPTPAKRPAYSVLDKSETWNQLKTPPAHWRSALRTMLQQVAEEGFA